MIPFRRRRRAADPLTRMMREAHRPVEVDVEAALAEVRRRTAPPPVTPPAPAAQRTPLRAASGRLTGLRHPGLAVAAVLERRTRTSVALLTAAGVLGAVVVNAWGVPGGPGHPAGPWRAAGRPPAANVSATARTADTPHRSPSARTPPPTASAKFTPLAGLRLAREPRVAPVLGPVTIDGHPYEEGWQVRFEHGVNVRALAFDYRLDVLSRRIFATIGAQHVARCVWTLSADNGASSRQAVESGRSGRIHLSLENASTLSIKVAASGRREGHGAVPACTMGDPRVRNAPAPERTVEGPAMNQRTRPPEGETASPSPTPTAPPEGTPTPTPAPTPSGERSTERRSGPNPSSSPSTDPE